MKWAVAVVILAVFGLLPAAPPLQFTDWSPAVNLGPTVNSPSVARRTGT